MNRKRWLPRGDVEVAGAATLNACVSCIKVYHHLRRKPTLETALQQAHQSALQLQLEAAAADCEVHKAALQQELTDLRDRAEEVQDDLLYNARQELSTLQQTHQSDVSAGVKALEIASSLRAELQQELAESQDNAGRLCQRAAELSDALRPPSQTVG